MVVFHPAVQGFQANDELVFPLLEALQEYNAPVYVHTGPPGMATPWQLADLAEAFPNLNFIMGHCGSTDYWTDVRVVMTSSDNIYLDSSLARPAAFRGYVDAVGVDRSIMSSFAPINDLVFEWDQMRLEAPPDEFAEIYGQTLLTLLGAGST